MKPAGMTFTSAATIPVAFLTVLYSFLDCAKLSSGDRVLIHVATGGVGLAAIQVARNIGAEIFATAGSRRKRAYLRFLGIEHVHNSRTTAFGHEIMKDTDGAGVTVVLNSLTGPNFKETSLGVCARGARFVEIGKVNIGTQEDVMRLRRDVAYFIVELAGMACEEPQLLTQLVNQMESDFMSGIFKGLPHVTFPLDLVREAFSYFQEAKHIGKVVLSIPEGKISPEQKISFFQPLFQPQSTYLITGGLGGIGLEVAKWMCLMGANHIVLTGRNIPNERQEVIIQQMNNSDDECRVVVIQADVGNFKECERLLELIQMLNLPPLRGIMHAAGVLSDAIVANQTWGKFETVYKPKVKGTSNLHQLTLVYDLEFFVMFSSLVAIAGMLGQSNHAAANGFMDSFAHYRISLGLPAMTINFGPWSDVGAAAKLKTSQEGFMGIRYTSPKQAIAGIETLFRQHTSQSIMADISDWTAVKKGIRLGHYLDEMTSETTKVTNAADDYKILIQEIRRCDALCREEKIQQFLVKVLKETLRIPDNEMMDPDQNFTEIGVDSLMAIELRNRLQGILGERQLTVSALQENRTVRSLSAHMQNLMNNESAIIDVELLVGQDSILPPDIKATTTPPVKPSEFKEILLTGATGHLGIHFIPSIQKENPNIIIHCVVRGRDTDEATARLVQTLKLYSLMEKVNWSHLRVVAGDLSKENFDLDAEIYENMAGLVDAVIHCAVKSKHLEEYNSGGDASLRANNVTSTVRILKFAGTGKTKHVLYASTLVAVTKANEDGVLSEEFPDPPDTGLELKNGYMLSKFVSEKLVAQAAGRGIPSTVLRYGVIFGDSQSGFMPTFNNHVWAILLSCLRVGKFPDFFQYGISVMAVDTAAAISTKILLKDSSETGVYNLTSVSFSFEDIKTTFQKFGVDVDYATFPEWRNLVFEKTHMEDNELAPFRALYEENEQKHAQILGMHPLASQFSMLQLSKLTEKVQRNCPDVESSIIPSRILLERHLKFYYSNH